MQEANASNSCRLFRQRKKFVSNSISAEQTASRFRCFPLAARASLPFLAPSKPVNDSTANAVVGFNGAELNDGAVDVYPRVMSELEVIAPTHRHRVIDLVQAAGVNVDD